MYKELFLKIMKEKGSTMLVNEKIIGEKVILRPINIDDTKDIVRWRNNPAVKQNFIFRQDFTEEMHINWLNTKVKSGEVVQYIIEDKKTGMSVGSVYYRDVDRVNNSAEYGIFIGEDNIRGKGFGTEAAQLFVRFGLEILGLHRISLRVLDGNDIAYRSYIKAGFKQEGVFRDMVKLDGEYRDVIFMAIVNK